MIGLVVLAVVVWAVARGVSGNTRAADDQAQGFVEQRVVALLQEFPRLGDEQIATLVRDELLNARRKDPAYFRWAVPETVTRIRRTIVLAVARERVLAEAEPAEEDDPKYRRCPACFKKNRRSRHFCRYCKADLR